MKIDKIGYNCFAPKLTRLPHLPSFCKLVIMSVYPFYARMPQFVIAALKFLLATPFALVQCSIISPNMPSSIACGLYVCFLFVATTPNHSTDLITRWTTRSYSSFS